MALLAAEASPFSGEIEVDESCFGSRRARGKRGRGAGGKPVVFGLLNRGDCVCTQIVPDAKTVTLWVLRNIFA
jgi:transposase-like protein